MIKGALKPGSDSVLELVASYNKFDQKSGPDFEGTFAVDDTQIDLEAVGHINWSDRFKTIYLN